MKMYTNSSNARRAAAAIVAKHPDLLEVATPVRAHTEQAMFYPAASVKRAIDNEMRTQLELDIKIVDANVPDDAEEEPVVPTKKRKAKPAKKAAKKPAKAAAPAKAGSKASQVLALIDTKDGATGALIEKKTGWAPHTVRGWVSLFNKSVREGEGSNKQFIGSSKTKGGELHYVLTGTDPKKK